MKINTLLSTYNGKEYIKEQLDSLFSQTYDFNHIIARDDNSKDETLEILNSYDLEIITTNKNLGAKNSFVNLLKYALKNSDVEYFLFCDQDDIWEKEKIEKTFSIMNRLEESNPNIPLLVHSDLKVVDQGLHTLSTSMWKYENIDPSKNSLNRLLLQNTITGCTVMINRKLAELSLPMPKDAIMHDWWIGLVASEFGKIAYLDESTIRYRQHNGNTIGAKGFSYLNIIKKGFNILINRNLYTKYLDINIAQAKAFLIKYKDDLDSATIHMLEDFSTIKTKSFWQKRKILLKYKLFKQGFIRNIGLFVNV